MMAYLDPSEAASIVHGHWATRQPAQALTSFAIDTRRIRPGETFVALKSDRQDGHGFLRQACDYRATAALVEQADADVPLPQLVVENTLDALQTLASSWRARFAGPIIGVTGSNGKTTVKEMLGRVLGAQWFRTKGNYNNHIGVPLSLLEVDSRAHAGAILEAGINRTGEMIQLARLIRPDYAIITSIGPSHLEGLGDLEGVAREKSILAAMVRPGGVVCIPASLLQYAPFRELPESVAVHALLLEGESIPDEWAAPDNVILYHYKWTENVHPRGMGTLQSREPVTPGDFTFRAGSSGMVSNLLLVVHLALHMGVPASTLQACLDSWRPFHQRGEILREGATTYYVDCYNANPASMEDALQRFAHLFPDQPHAYVLGTMNELGQESAHWHRQTAAKIPLQPGAPVYLVGEHAADYLSGLRDQGIDPERIQTVDDKALLREQLNGFSGAVFLKGSRAVGLEAILPKGGAAC